MSGVRTFLHTGDMQLGPAVPVLVLMRTRTCQDRAGGTIKQLFLASAVPRHVRDRRGVAGLSSMLASHCLWLTSPTEVLAHDLPKCFLDCIVAVKTQPTLHSIIVSSCFQQDPLSYQVASCSCMPRPPRRSPRRRRSLRQRPCAACRPCPLQRESDDSEPTLLEGLLVYASRILNRVIIIVTGGNLSLRHL